VIQTMAPPASRPVIVLLAGFLGFDRLLWWQMFRGVKLHLERTGWRVVQPNPDPVGSIVQRAHHWAREINEQVGSETPLHLIGHSMGGLDARYIASPGGLDWGHRVRSVTTLATPHRGSPAASTIPTIIPSLIRLTARVGSRIVPQMVERAVLRKIASPNWPALSDLAEKQTVEIFNREIIDDPRVLYYSYAAVLDNRETGLVSRLRRLEGKITGMSSPHHDGLVELESAKWGDYIGACNTDHGGVIGMHIVPWKMPKFDHLALFDEISKRLAGFSCD
jgi:triacylglycerol lipase